MEIADQMAIYTKDFIDKKIKTYLNTWEVRYDPIMITRKDGTEYPMTFSGIFYNAKAREPGSPANRYFTWTDLFYIAAIESLSDKTVYVTRYPIVDYFGIFPSKCLPLSTIKTAPMIINKKLYPYYPVIDLSTPRDKIGTQFIDTVTMSNMHLDIMGGDWIHRGPLSLVIVITTNL